MTATTATRSAEGGVLHSECVARDAALAWVARNQFGRRNLKPQHVTLHLGHLYNREKRQGLRMDRAALKGQVAPVEEMAVQAKGNVPVDGEGEAKDTGDVGEAGAVGGEETCGNSSHKSAGGRTAERLARQYGGNEKTYRNAGRFVDNLAKLKCI